MTYTRDGGTIVRNEGRVVIGRIYEVMWRGLQVQLYVFIFVRRRCTAL